MDINIIGDGSFGSFLKKELPNHGFNLDTDAGTVILAVPFSAYAIIAEQINNPHIHLVNVCSVQEPSTDVLLQYAHKVTSIHPLFGVRTPENKRNTIVTHTYSLGESFEGKDWTDEQEFLSKFEKFSKLIWSDLEGLEFTPASHDKIMAKTHAAALLAAKQAKPFIQAAKGISDEYIPNSFRLLREFVKTLDDMPLGTVESIMANPYI